MDVPSRRWSLLLVSKTNGIVAQVDHDWSKHPDHYEKVVVVEEEHANREIERLRAELAECRRACSNAAHLLEQARIWDGSAWHWNPLHATAALRAWEILTAALAAKGES